MSLPNTFIIGVQKAGTTAFYDWLSQHPEVYAPKEIKDIHFFSLDEYYNKGIDYLDRLYNQKGKEPIILNAGVNYMFESVALERIKALDADVKILIVLRDPVKRAFSAYNYFYKLGVEDLTFEEALDREQNKIFTDPVEKATYTYLNHGKYFNQLNKVFDLFPKQNIKILIYEKLVIEKDKHMSEVFNFLNINRKFKCQYVNANITGKARFRILNKFLTQNNKYKRAFQKAIPYKKIFNLKLRNKISLLLLKLNTQQSATNKLDEQSYQKLRQYFETDIEQLTDLLQINLNNYWKF